MSHKGTYRQYDLASGAARMTCWLRWDAPLDVGAVVTLDDDERPWLVTGVSQTELLQPPDRRWNVGGLTHTGR